MPIFDDGAKFHGNFAQKSASYEQAIARSPYRPTRTPVPLQMIQFDYFFQMGWNRQLLEVYYSLYTRSESQEPCHQFVIFWLELYTPED